MSTAKVVPACRIVPPNDPYPSVTVHLVPNKNDEYCLKLCQARSNKKGLRWNHVQTGFGVRFHANTKGVKFFTKGGAKGVKGPAIDFPGGADANLLAAMRSAWANFRLVF
jgi:hypothetical protein